LILRSVIEWSNPEYNPIHDRRDLARVRRTPVNVVRAYLAECVLFPWREPLEIPLAWIARDTTCHILIIVLIINIKVCNLARHESELTYMIHVSKVSSKFYPRLDISHYPT